MKITELEIRNFKAVRNITLKDLPEVVVVAGPNGCGKSCVLDAIRLLKSVYGGYGRQDEWHHFFNEFQLNLQNPDEVRRLFTDVKQPVLIRAAIQLTKTERDYIRRNARRILAENLWKQEMGGGRKRRYQTIIASLHDASTNIDQAAKDATSKILADLKKDPFEARLTISPELTMDTEPNAALEFAFGIYDGKNIGIIDYHGPNRQYQRERIGGINVNIEETSERMAQHALFESQNKYSNVKSELASAFVRDLLIEKAGGNEQQVPSIIDTLQELFSTFLPGKKFGGPIPGAHGELTFPVTLAAGGPHDIDDLSSGEKELVYGYLRIRNVSPRNSIILLDEPELHLNPRLVLGLPAFYRQHLGLDLNNQLWMVTHSDAFLRDAFKSGGFSIFHMTPPSTASIEENQVVRVSEKNQIDRAIVDLIGDIAGYRPGNKIVIFESSESAAFDSLMTLKLFPALADAINPISGDNKYGVRQLYSALKRAGDRIKLPFQVYAIVDRDADAPREDEPVTSIYHWDVYHIENYLLEPEFIRKVIDDNPSYAAKMTSKQIEIALRRCAEETLPDLVAHQLRLHVDACVRPCFSLGFAPTTKSPALGFSSAISRVRSRVEQIQAEELSEARLLKKQHEFEKRLRAKLGTKKWRAEFRGRDVLKRFCGKHLQGLPYVTFRDQIISRMADAGHRPSGMTKIVNKILSD